jgi:hypothetical protein
MANRRTVKTNFGLAELVLERLKDGIIPLLGCNNSSHLLKPIKILKA